MKHAVLKLGGSVLGDSRGAAAIADIIDSYAAPLVVIVSALKGVTDRLASAADARSSLPSHMPLVARLRDEHRAFAEAFGAPAAALEAASFRIDGILCRLLRLLGSGGSRAQILSTGERLSATLVALALASLGRPAPIVEPRELGLVAREGDDGPYVDLSEAGPRIRAALSSLSDAVVPGFYCVDECGRTALLGRGGSDYSAALIAAGLGARLCDLVKDVPGFLTADPAIVASAQPVFELSYEEAEALAKGGAKVLHHSAVEPLRAAGVPLRIIGISASGGATRIGPRLFGQEGVLALALAAGPAGSARITVACRGCASKSAALVISALEARGIAARSFSMGRAAVSFSILVDGSKGEEGLGIAHGALFAAGPRAKARSSVISPAWNECLNPSPAADAFR